MPEPPKHDIETVAERTSADELGVGRLSLSVRMGGQTSWVTLFPGRTYVVGRDASADIPIPAPAVSREHAKLSVSALGVQVTDLGSRNGTKLNGQRITQPVMFRPGDELRIGGVALTVHGETSVTTRGMFDHERFMARVDEELDRSRRYRRALSLVVLRMNTGSFTVSSEILPTYERLREVLRPMDPVGHFGGSQLEILLPEADGAEAMRVVHRVATRLASPGRAVHMGVSTYPADGTDRERMLQMALQLAREAMRQGVGHLQSDRSRTGSDAAPEREQVVVESPRMVEVFEMAHRASQSDITVLVQGETGVGKEIIAETIHDAGPRRAGPLVRVNCAALPEHLIESELFGHEKGAFTGALRTQPGLFEQAAGGTLFLDEIGEVPLALQPKLLRVLETRTIRRIGATREKSVDVRVVAATNQDLRNQVAEGLFRDDLYFRLAGISLHIPPLRERKEDIPPLVRLFAERAARNMRRGVPSIPDEVMDKLVAYRWPGNVREVMNLLDRAMLVCDGPVLSLDAFPPSVAQSAPVPVAPSAGPVGSSGAGLKENMDAVERELLLDALRTCGGNQTRAAKLLSMPRRTFIYKMKRLGITKQDYLAPK